MQSQRSAFEVGAAPGNLKGWHDTALAICMLVALTVMVFMRRRVGLRKIRKGYLFSMAFVLVAFNWLGNLHLSLFGGVTSEGSTALRNYAFAFLVLGLWEHHRRWQELQRGEITDSTRSHGKTWFDFLPLREDHIYLVVDPLATFLIGALLRYRLDFGLLGLWVMLAAVAFRIVEKTVHDRGIDRNLDMLDGLFEAEGGAALMSYFRSPKAPQPGGGHASNSVATGADAHLASLIAKRKEQTDMEVNQNDAA